MWNPTEAQQSILKVICGNRPDRKFSASQEPGNESILVTVEGGVGGRRIHPDGTIDLLTEAELQHAFGDYLENDGACPQTPEERITELRESLGDSVDQFSEDHDADLLAEVRRLSQLLSDHGITPN